MTEKNITYTFEQPNDLAGYELTFEPLGNDPEAAAFQLDESAVGSIAMRKFVKTDFALGA